MRSALATIVFILLVSPLLAVAQDHAPTRDQCDSDRRLWAKEKATILTMRELSDRSTETEDCISLYEASFSAWDTALYEQAEVIYLSQMHHREFDFLKRHGALPQFLREDVRENLKKRMQPR